MGASDVSYRDDLLRTFWAYRRKCAAADEIFDPRYADEKSPPVYGRACADQNVIVPPDADPEVIRAIRRAIPKQYRHRWFASMRSSQGLAQSVFAGLAEVGRLDAIEGLAAEDGNPAFFKSGTGMTLQLEHTMAGLNEPAPTSVDAMFDGPRRVAVEVKFSEPEFGCCSRPKLRPDRDKAKFASEHCDGSYTVQRNRTDRCALSQRGIRYWCLIPELFTWSASEDYAKCPLNLTFQLVRNVLGACLRDDGGIDVENSHALVVYDARNPAFRPGGNADEQWLSAISALRYPRLLRRISWQRVADHLARYDDLEWLTSALCDKYGIGGGNPSSPTR